MKIKKNITSKASAIKIKNAIFSEIQTSLTESLYQCWDNVSEEMKDGLSCYFDLFENTATIIVRDGMLDDCFLKKPWLKIRLSELVDEIIDHEDDQYNLEISKYRDDLAKDLEKQAARLRKSAQKLRAKRKTCKITPASA